MNRFILLIKIVLILFIIPSIGNAAGDFTSQSPITIKVKLGTQDGKLIFSPNRLSFETGKLYKLVLHNPSPQKHYFSSGNFARSIFTRKVQVLSATGKTIAEIKGHIQEIEVLPGGTAEWWFVPVKTLSGHDLKCTVKGHTEAGMVGSIKIK